MQTANHSMFARIVSVSNGICREISCNFIRKIEQ